MFDERLDASSEPRIARQIDGVPNVGFTQLLWRQTENEASGVIPHAQGANFKRMLNGPFYTFHQLKGVVFSVEIN